MRYVEFPHDVALDTLVNDCARRNRNGEQLSNEFVQASTLVDSSEKDDMPAVERSDLGPLRPIPGSDVPQIEPHNVNDTPPLIVRVWRWIVTLCRQTSL
jgi:hypothetical protein